MIIRLPIGMTTILLTIKNCGKNAIAITNLEIFDKHKIPGKVQVKIPSSRYITPEKIKHHFQKKKSHVYKNRNHLPNHTNHSHLRQTLQQSPGRTSTLQHQTPQRQRRGLKHSRPIIIQRNLRIIHKSISGPPRIYAISTIQSRRLDTISLYDVHRNKKSLPDNFWEILKSLLR